MRSQRPVPILLLAQALGQGGSERQLAEVATSLDRSRFAAHVGYFREGGFRIRELSQAGIPTVHIPVPSFRSLAAVRGAMLLRRYIRQHEIALVHTFDVPMNCFAVPVARACRTPAILSSQRALRRLSSRWEQAVLRFTDRLVDGTVVNCEFMSRHMREDERVRPERLMLCYNGVNTQVFQPGPRRRPLALQDASVVVGTVCALRPEKGLETLIEGFAKIILDPGTGTGSGVRLAIVGSGPMLEPLRQLAARLGVESRCHFEPSTQDVATWFRAIDIFVLPSLSEALSNSLMEAMASGCAAAASDVGGNPELVAAGTTGMLFQPQDSLALAQCVRTLIADSDLRSRLSTAGAESIRTRFSSEASVRRMEQIYTSILRQRTAPA